MKDVAIKLPEVKGEIVPQDEATALMSQAIDKGVDVATLEKLLLLRRELKQEKAKEMYDRAMAQFQAACPTITKTKQVKDTYGKVLYSYAPIESIVAQIKEALKDNGFSYSTSMELTDNGVKVCVKVTHATGHSEETCMNVPLGNKTGIMSASQQVAAATTFAKRYAFCNAFGILTGDEDNDGATIHNEPVSQQRSVPASSIAPQIPVKQEVREYLKPMMITNDQKVEIIQLLSKAKKSLPYLNNAIRSTKALKANTYQDLTYKNANTLIEKMKREIEYPETPTNGDEEKIDNDQAEKAIEQQKLTN